MRTADCPNTVTFYGALFREGDVWICMECMGTSLDKFYTKAYHYSKPLNEDVLGKIAFTVIELDQTSKMFISCIKYHFHSGCICPSLSSQPAESDSPRC